MLSIFIGYGGTKAEEVAKKLENFLQTETKMDVFLGSPQSASLTANAHDFIAKINKQLVERHLAIFVCHEGTPRSQAMIDEINLLITKKMSHKIIIFSASDNCVPSQFRQKLWRPLHFTPEKPEESFCRLANEVYRSYIEKTEPSTVVPENTEMPIQ
jgi:hypothetical protein